MDDGNSTGFKSNQDNKRTVSLSPSPKVDKQEIEASVKSMRRVATEEFLRTGTSGNLSANSIGKRSPLTVNIRGNKDSFNNTAPLPNNEDRILLIDSFQADPQRQRIETIIKEFEITIRLVDTESDKRTLITTLNDNLNKFKSTIDALISQNKYKDILIEELKTLKISAANHPQVISDMQSDLNQLHQRHESLNHQHESSFAQTRGKESERFAKIEEGLVKIENQHKIITILEKNNRELDERNKNLAFMLMEGEKYKLELGKAMLSAIEKNDVSELKAKFRNFVFDIQPDIEKLNKEKAEELQTVAEDLKRRFSHKVVQERSRSEDKRINDSQYKKDSASPEVISLNLIESLTNRVYNLHIQEENKYHINSELERLKAVVKSSMKFGNKDQENREHQKLLDKIREYTSLIQNQNLLLKISEDQNAKLIDLVKNAQNKYLSRDLTDEKTRKIIRETLEELGQRRDIYLDMFKKCKKLTEK